MSEEIEPPNGPLKLCKECGQELSEAAVKCFRCSAYQNWRRHVHFSQVGLALGLSVLALTSQVASNWSPILNLFRSTFAFSGEGFGIQIIGVSEDRIQFLAKNWSGRDVTSRGLDCFLSIPVLPYASGEIIEDDSDSIVDLMSDIYKGSRFSVGVIIATYELEPPITIRSGEEQMISAVANYFEPTFLGIIPGWPDSVCIIAPEVFGREPNQIYAPVSARLLSHIDINSFLEVAGFSSSFLDSSEALEMIDRYRSGGFTSGAIQ